MLHISKSFQANQLTLNVEKTSIVIIPTKFLYYPPNLVCADQVLTELYTVKFLALHLDNHLKWKPHVHFILHKKGTACFVIRIVSHILDIDAI